MIFLITLVILLVAMSFYVMSDAKKALVVIAAMMCSLLFGGGIASLFTPITPTEESRFPRILGTLGGAVSGFTLAKIDSIVEFLKGTMPHPTTDSIESSFLLLAPLACFLVGLNFLFVLRAALTSFEENRLQILRRKLHEEKEITRARVDREL